MLNSITLLGRLTRNPELRTTPSGINVAHFSIAVERDFGKEKETDFFDCVAWRQTGEFVAKYFAKGKPILVNGSMRMRKYTDKSGNPRVAYEVQADNVYFAGGEKVTATDAGSGFTDIDDSDGKLPWEDDGEGLPL